MAFYRSLTEMLSPQTCTTFCAAIMKQKPAFCDAKTANEVQKKRQWNEGSTHLPAQTSYDVKQEGRRLQSSTHPAARLVWSSQRPALGCPWLHKFSLAASWWSSQSVAAKVESWGSMFFKCMLHANRIICSITSKIFWWQKNGPQED